MSDVVVVTHYLKCDYPDCDSTTEIMPGVSYEEAIKEAESWEWLSWTHVPPDKDYCSGHGKIIR